MATDSLRKGSTKGCGSCGKKTHGLEGTIYYRWWSHIRERCYSRKCKDFPNYGGRGIKMQPTWKSDAGQFKKDILNDLGDKPGPDFSLDRIDNNKNYEQGNMRWASRSEQQMNKQKPKNTSSSFRGVSKSITPGKFRAHIRYDGKVIQLGTFCSEDAAARAYDIKALETRGANARLNFP